ncbi:MAG: alpha/beta hydrolase [Bacteroidetes bacterium]|nr:alpha/beta hydrolase [Bacteroidota bacterium]
MLGKPFLIISFLFICFIGKGQSKAFEVQVYGKGQPIILIPGYSCSGDVWKETVNHLKNKYECHVLTLAGYNGVPAIDTPVLKTIKNAIVEYITQKKWKHVILIGHSLGGFMSNWVASEIPDKISKMIIVDAVPAYAAMQNENINFDSLKLEAKKNYKATIQYFKSQEDSDYIAKNSKAMYWQVSDTARARQIATWSFHSDRTTLGATFLEMSTTDLRQDIKKIKCPVLIMPSLYGTEAASLKITNEQYANLQNKEIVVAHSKHFIMYDQPEWMYKQIDEFLKK